MMVLENYSEQCLEMMSKLLLHMDKATIITSDQMKAVRYCASANTIDINRRLCVSGLPTYLR